MYPLLPILPLVVAAPGMSRETIRLVAVLMAALVRLGLMTRERASSVGRRWLLRRAINLGGLRHEGRPVQRQNADGETLH